MLLLDMWVELYDLDDEGMYDSENLLDLSLRNIYILFTTMYNEPTFIDELTFK